MSRMEDEEMNEAISESSIEESEVEDVEDIEEEEEEEAVESDEQVEGKAEEDADDRTSSAASAQAALELEEVKKLMSSLVDAFKLRQVFDPSAPIKKGKKAPVPLPDTAFPVPAAIAALSAKAQDAFLDRTADLTVRMITLLRELSLAQRQLLERSGAKPVMNAGAKDVLESAFADSVDPQSLVGMSRHALENSLWKRVVSNNRALAQLMERMEDSNENKPNKKRKTEEEKPSFRDYYMNLMTDTFADELDQLRQGDKLSSGKALSYLIDTLENGQNAFSEMEQKFVVSSLAAKRSDNFSSKNQSVHKNKARV